MPCYESSLKKTQTPPQLFRSCENTGALNIVHGRDVRHDPKTSKGRSQVGIGTGDTVVRYGTGHRSWPRCADLHRISQSREVLTEHVGVGRGNKLTDEVHHSISDVSSVQGLGKGVLTHLSQRDEAKKERKRERCTTARAVYCNDGTFRSDPIRSFCSVLRSSARFHQPSTHSSSGCRAEPCSSLRY